MRRLDARGVAAIEFAAAAPVTLLTIAMAYAAMMLDAGKTALDAGAAAAARAAAIGATDENGNRAAEIRRIVTRHVCPAAAGTGTGCYWSSARLVESDDGVVSPLRISLRSYVDPRNVGRPEPFADAAPQNGVRDPGEGFTDVNGNGVWDADMGAVGPGGSGDYVAFELEMAQDVGHPALAAVFGAYVLHRATLVARNEPF